MGYRLQCSSYCAYRGPRVRSYATNRNNRYTKGFQRRSQIRTRLHEYMSPAIGGKVFKLPWNANSAYSTTEHFITNCVWCNHKRSSLIVTLWLQYCDALVVDFYLYKLIIISRVFLLWLNAILKYMSISLLRPGRGAMFCNQHVCPSVCLFACLSVCPLPYLKNYMSKFHEIFLHFVLPVLWMTSHHRAKGARIKDDAYV